MYDESMILLEVVKIVLTYGRVRFPRRIIDIIVSSKLQGPLPSLDASEEQTLLKKLNV